MYSVKTAERLRDLENMVLELCATSKAQENKIALLLEALGLDSTKIPTTPLEVHNLLARVRGILYGSGEVNVSTALFISKLLIKITPEHLEIFSRYGEQSPWVLLDATADYVMDRLEENTKSGSTWLVAGMVKEGRRNLRTSVYYYVAKREGLEKACKLLPPTFDDFHSKILQVISAKTEAQEA